MVATCKHDQFGAANQSAFMPGRLFTDNVIERVVTFNGQYWSDSDF